MENIKKLIKKCIANISYSEFMLNGPPDTRNFVTDNSARDIFLNFNDISYVRWLKYETDKINSTVKFDFNIVYTIQTYKDEILKNGSHFEKYKAHSECICMENKSFKNISKDSNIFLKDNLSSNIVEKFDIIKN